VFDFVNVDFEKEEERHRQIFYAYNHLFVFRKIWSCLSPMLTRVSYSQDGSDTSSVGAPDRLSETPVMNSFTIP
jgi:hypothetical protein